MGAVVADVDPIAAAGLLVAALGVVAAVVGAAIGYDRWKVSREVKRAAVAVRNNKVDELIVLLTEDLEHESLFGTLRRILAAQETFGERLDRHLVAEEAETRALRQEIHELRARVEELG